MSPSVCYTQNGQENFVTKEFRLFKSEGKE